MKYTHGLGQLPLMEIGNSGAERIMIFDQNGAVGIKRSEDLSYLVRDHLGSTRIVMDEDGVRIGEFNYNDFGETIERAEASRDLSETRYRYTGQEWDDELQQYNYLAREYDQGVGRFDSIDLAREGFSPYTYVRNNPIELIDPDGMVPKKATSKPNPIRRGGIYKKYKPLHKSHSVMAFGHGQILPNTFTIPNNIEIKFYGPPGGAMSGSMADDALIDYMNGKVIRGPKTIGLRSDPEYHTPTAKNEIKKINLAKYPIVYSGGEKIMDHKVSGSSRISVSIGSKTYRAGIYKDKKMTTPLTSGSSTTTLSNIASNSSSKPTTIHWMMCRSSTEYEKTNTVGDKSKSIYFKDEDKMSWNRGSGKGTKVYY